MADKSEFEKDAKRTLEVWDNWFTPVERIQIYLLDWYLRLKLIGKIKGKVSGKESLATDFQAPK